jgi:TP901 family phage tail tape measure protein
MQDENTFKSTYDIMDELSKKWQSLTDIQRASITELIAGKRQGNVVSSLLTQFDTAREALETSANSEGSATKEHQKWLESMEAKTQQFKATWEGLSQDLMDDSFLKGLVDTGTNLLNIIDGIVDGVGTLPVLLTTVTGILSAKKNVGRIKLFILVNMPTVVIVLFRYR